MKSCYDCKLKKYCYEHFYHGYKEHEEFGIFRANKLVRNLRKWSIDLRKTATSKSKRIHCASEIIYQRAIESKLSSIEKETNRAMSITALIVIVIGIILSFIN